MNRQQTLPGVEKENEDLPFPTMALQEKRCKIFGIAINMDWNGERLIHWHHERCGKSEEAHAIMKDDLAGGKLPSGNFGANAAWWWTMILALNLNNIMKSVALDAKWQPKRLKAIRFRLINLPGRVVEHARTLWVRLSGHNTSFDLLLTIRRKIRELQPVAALKPVLFQLNGRKGASKNLESRPLRHLQIVWRQARHKQVVGRAKKIIPLRPWKVYIVRGGGFRISLYY
jgi:hypothetical protein